VEEFGHSIFSFCWLMQAHGSWEAPDILCCCQDAFTLGFPLAELDRAGQECAPSGSLPRSSTGSRGKAIPWTPGLLHGW